MSDFSKAIKSNQSLLFIIIQSVIFFQMCQINNVFSIVMLCIVANNEDKKKKKNIS